MIPIASRMRRLGAETAFEVLAQARALEAKGKHIIHLEIGEPDFDTPAISALLPRKRSMTDSPIMVPLPAYPR